MGEIKTATTPCRSGFVCQQVGLRQYQCMSENAECKLVNLCPILISCDQYSNIVCMFRSAPCVMARANDPNIECEPNGNFRPLQCSPVVEEPGNVSNTTTAEEETRRRTGPRTRGTRRTRRTMGQQTCRCVDPGNGTTIEGTERLLNERSRSKRPNCDKGKCLTETSVSGGLFIKPYMLDCL